MSSNRVKYDAKSPHGQLLSEAMDSIIEARGKIDRTLKAAQQMSYGSDWAAVELEFGLDAGKGQDMLYFLQSTSDALNAQPLLDITAQLDQG